MPISGTLYVTSQALVSCRSAYAGGLADSVSNFAMYAGPVAYFAF
jgi:hypothetical protein